MFGTMINCPMGLHCRCEAEVIRLQVTENVSNRVLNTKGFIFSHKEEVRRQVIAGIVCIAHML